MGNKQNNLLSSITESLQNIFKNKQIYDQDRIISVGNGMTLLQFSKILLSYTDSIPLDIINIIADYMCIYNLQGIIVSEFPICPERPLSSQNYTAYCVTSPSGIIFTSDSSSREVRRFTYSGEPLESFHTTPMTYYKVNGSTFVTIPCHYTGPLTLYDKPYNIALDKDENLYLTDYYNDIVIKYNRDGKLASPKCIIGVGKNIIHPLGIAVDNIKNLLYISSDSNKPDLFKIKTFTLDGIPVETLHIPHKILNLSIYNDNIVKLYESDDHNYIELYFSIISLPISNTSQIAINEIGNLYVADVENNSIQVFKADNFNHIKTVKLRDSKGKSIKPTTVTVDEQGNVIVISCTENKVFIFR